MDLKHKYYKTFPMDHPDYASELSTHRLKMFSKVHNNPRKNPLTYDYTADWKKRWDVILEESFIKEEQNMKEEIRMQLNLPLDNKQKAMSSTAIKHYTVQETTELLHKRNCDEQQEVIPVKRIKERKNEKKSVLVVEKLQEKNDPSKDGEKSVLIVEKLQEKDDPMILLSICQQLKSYVMGNLAVKITNLFNEALKSCNDKNLNVLQDHKNVKLLEKVKLILIDQTSDNWLPASKTNEMKKVIENITVLLKKIEHQPTTIEQSYEFLSEEDIKTLVLNYSELDSEDQNDLVNYFEIMKLKNNEFYNKITNIIQQEITLSSENEPLFVDKVNDELIVFSDDEDDSDVAEVVLKAIQIVDENSCEFVSELAANEIPTFEISSDEN